MRDRTVLTLAVVVMLLLTFRFFMDSFEEHEKAKRDGFYQEDLRAATTTSASAPKCSMSRVCPPDHFAFSIRSGAANVVGPKICFNGKIIMSTILNNVGPGLNIVIINDESGDVEKFGYLNMVSGLPEQIQKYLEDINPGKIVLVATFDDAAAKLTNEMRELFVEMGSTLIVSLKRRDNWVFAGRTGTKIKSFFEKQAVNDEKTNAFDGWPQTVEAGFGDNENCSTSTGSERTTRKDFKFFSALMSRLHNEMMAFGQNKLK